METYWDYSIEVGIEVDHETKTSDGFPRLATIGPNKVKDSGLFVQGGPFIRVTDVEN